MAGPSDQGPRRLGPFRLEERLGAGSVGVIYRATPTDPSLKMPAVVAIKVLPEQDHDLRHIERFKHEVAIARAAQSPHLAKIYGAGESGDGPFMIVEFLDGKPLSRIIPRLRKQPELLSIDQRIKIFVGAARGIAALHTAFDPEDGSGLGATHRDISPGNLMLTKEGRLVVIDLGLGRSKLRHFETQTGVVVGTPAFMAPEVARGGIASTQADVYALGVALFEFITLEHFVPRTNIARMLQLAQKPDHNKLAILREDLQSILRTALAVNPNERFESAVEFEAALQPLVQDNLDVAAAARALVTDPGTPFETFDEETKIDHQEPEFVSTPTAMPLLTDDPFYEVSEATWIELDGKRQPLLPPSIVKDGLPPEPAAPTIVDPPRATPPVAIGVHIVPDPAVPTAAADTKHVDAPRAPTPPVAKKASSALRFLALGVVIAGAFLFGYLTKTVTSTSELPSVARELPEPTQPAAKPAAVQRAQVPSPSPPTQPAKSEKTSPPRSVTTAKKPAPIPNVPAVEEVQPPADAGAVLGRLSRRIAALQTEQPQRRAELEAELAKAVRWAAHPDTEVALKQIGIIEKRVLGTP